MKKLSENFAHFEPDTLKIVDSIPIPLLVGVRCYRSIVARICQRYRIRPDWGYCAAKKMYYFGFKLMAITEGSKIWDYTLVPASTSEQAALIALVSRKDLRGFSVFGDKGFLMNPEDKKMLTERQINLEAIPRKNMKQNLIENLKQKKKLRKAVETSFSQLSSLFDLTHFILRSITGFAVTIIRKVLAYNINRGLSIFEHNQKELLAI